MIWPLLMRMDKTGSGSGSGRSVDKTGRLGAGNYCKKRPYVYGLWSLGIMFLPRFLNIGTGSMQAAAQAAYHERVID